jgi:DNA-binding MarR family transcriptional regulator
MEIEKEIVQSRFKTPLEKAVVNILFTGNWFTSKEAMRLKPFGITLQQYNILRILRGQHPNPATITLLTERMLDKMSNASRLVDKLQLKGLVERATCPSDRRQAHVRINDAGLALLLQMDRALEEGRSGVGNLSDQELETLSTLLDRLRGSCK